MADTFGLKIGLEGEKEFKSQLKEIEQSFKVLGSEMNLVSSQFDKNDKSVESLTARNEVLQKSIVNQKSKIDVLKTALDNASKSFGENDARTKAWQVKLNNAQAELNKMEKEVESNTKAIDSMGDELTDTSSKAENFSKEVKEAGNEAEESGNKFQSLGTICKSVAAAIAVAFAAVSAAAIKAGKELIDMTKEGAAYADNILTQSSITGIATDKLQEYAYAAELVDVSLDTLTGSMRKNINSMKNAANGSATYLDAYEKLGISITDTNGNLRDSETVYWELIEALGNVENETERDALAMTLLGRSAQDLNPLIEAGADRVKELAEQAHEAGYVLSDELLKSYGAFDDQMQYFNNGITAARNALGTVLLPLLTDLTRDGVSLLGEFTRGVQDANGDLSKIGEVIGEILPKALNVVMKYVPTILDLIKNVVISLGKAIIDNIDILIDSVTEVVMSILNALISGLPQITEGLIKLISALGKAILDNLPLILSAVTGSIETILKTLSKSLTKVLPIIINALKDVSKTILANAPALLKTLLDVVKSLAKGLLDALPIFIEALPEVIQGVVDFLVEAIPEIIDAIITIVMAIVDALPTIIQSIIDVLPQIIQSIIDGLLTLIPQLIECVMRFVLAVVDALPQIIEMLVNQLPKITTSIINTLLSDIPKFVETGVKLLTSLLENLPQIIVELVANLPQIISSMVSALGDGVAQFAEVGKNLVRGLWDGIQSLAGWIWNQVSNWASNLWNGIKSFFGIHSPSKKFMFLGDMMMEGLGQGLMESGDDVLKDASLISKDLLDEFNDLDANFARLPTDYDINANVPDVLPSGTNPRSTTALASSGGVSIELHIDNFNNYSNDDIASLTEEVLATASGFLTRKEFAY